MNQLIWRLVCRVDRFYIFGLVIKNDQPVTELVPVDWRTVTLEEFWGQVPNALLETVEYRTVLKRAYFGGAAS